MASFVTRIRGVWSRLNAKDGDPPSSSSWLTALERVAAANSSAAKHGLVRSRNDNKTYFVVCPIVAKQLLAKHESGQRRQSTISGHDSGDAGESACNDTSDPRLEQQPSVLLHKPSKKNMLLSKALTNANGERWHRQRPIIQRALGDSRLAREVSARVAVDATKEYIRRQTMGSRTFRRRHGTSPAVIVEVRDLALTVALSAIVASVFGTEQTTELHALLTQRTRDLFEQTLLPIRGDTKKAKALDDIVRSMVDRLAGLRNKGTVPRCLAINLLQYERPSSALAHEKEGEDDKACHKSKKEDQGYLTRDEVVGNCHSALLAGTQTICTTLVGALLHLADRLDLQQAQDIVSTRAIVNEVLRILPPVATLPRCPIGGNIEIPANAATEGHGSMHTSTSTIQIDPNDGVLLFDVLSMAHRSAANNEHGPRGSIPDQKLKSASWKFCPAQKDHTNITARTDVSDPQQLKSPTPIYAWGIGGRTCPAGNLSVICIATVLDYLRKTWTWRWKNPCKDSVPNDDGWLSVVSYRPTLSYPDSLWLELTPSL